MQRITSNLHLKSEQLRLLVSYVEGRNLSGETINSVRTCSLMVALV